MTFHVTVQNTYHLSSSVNLMLYIDGQPVGETSGTISPDSTKTFSIRWFAEAGTHSYRITAYSSRLGGGAVSSEGTVSIGPEASAPRVDGGGGSNSINGTIRVSPSYQIFGAALKVFPEEVVGGGPVYFTVEVRNYESGVLSLVGFVEDESGAVIKRIDGLEGRIPANGEKNITFSYTVYGAGEHTFKLFLDNYDGKPNGEGEEHWSKTTVEVNPVGNIIANMSCNPAVVPLGESTTCTVHLGLRRPATVTLNLEEVDFGGKKVWPDGLSGVIVSRKTVTLTPTNMQEDLTITIDINDELADYYFGKPIYKTYLGKFVGHSYLIEAKFTELNYPVSDVITVVPFKGDETDGIINYGLTLTEIGGFVRTAVSSDPVGILITLGVYGVTHENDIQWTLEEIIGNGHFPQEQDNNDVVGE